MLRAPLDRSLLAATSCRRRFLSLPPELRHPQRRARDLFFAEAEVHKDAEMEAVLLPRLLAHASERLRTERLLHLLIECGKLLKLGRLVAHVRDDAA